MTSVCFFDYFFYFRSSHLQIAAPFNQTPLIASNSSEKLVHDDLWSKWNGSSAFQTDNHLIHIELWLSFLRIEFAPPTTFAQKMEEKKNRDRKKKEEQKLRCAPHFALIKFASECLSLVLHLSFAHWLPTRFFILHSFHAIRAEVKVFLSRYASHRCFRIPEANNLQQSNSLHTRNPNRNAKKNHNN